MANTPNFGSSGHGAAFSGGGSDSFLQNLLQLAKLTSLDLSAHLLYNFAFTGSDNKLAVGLGVPGASGWVPIGTSDNPFVISSPVPTANTPIKKSAVYTSSFTNKASPVTVFSKSFTPADKNSTILIIAAAQIANVSAGASTVDLSIQNGSTVLTSSRTFQNTDIGNTTVFTYLNSGTGGAITVNVVATLVTGTTNLTSANAYLSIVEY